MSDSLRARLEQARQERVAEARDKRLQVSLSTGAAAINPGRREDDIRRLRELTAPSMPDAKPATADSPILDQIPFYCYDGDGDLAVVRFYVQGAPIKE